MEKNNRKGDAMIAVLCIMTVLVTLCLAMLLAASVLINNAQMKFSAEQARLSAVSMSKELEKSLCGTGDPGALLRAYVETHIQLAGSNPQWPYYNPDEIGHGENAAVYRDFTMTGGDDPKTGKITARMYWEWEAGASPIRNTGVRLHLEVTAEKGGQKHMVASVYDLYVEETTKDWSWKLEERS